MGTFYTNFMFYETTKEKIEQVLLNLRRDAYISPRFGRFIFVYERLSEIQEDDLIAHLSLELNCSALAATVDDDIFGFCYELYVKGNLLDKYISRPNSRIANERLFPKGGDADKLCSAFNIRKASNSVRVVLRTPNDGSTYLSNQDRHIALIKSLRIDPFWAAGVGGYDYIKNNNIVRLTDKDPSFKETIELLTKVGVK
jgi:hypothetical protein